jgi:hypothetical protein
VEYRFAIMDDRDADLKDRLQKAVRGVEVPPFLATRIRAELGTEPKRSPGWSALAALGGAVALCAVTVVGYERGHLRLTRDSQDAYISLLSQNVASVMSVGLRDHVHCSVFRKYPKTPNSLNQMLSDLGPSFSPLLSVVREHVPEQYALVMAHRCGYKERHFVHFTFRNSDTLLSVVIARKEDGEDLSPKELGNALSESGIPVYRSHIQRFQIAAFDAGDYLAYVVSDLSGDENSRIAVALSPGVKSILAQQRG